jgi:hypothetical protein
MHRVIALALAALVLFPVLAKSGIWDPYELDAADLARRIAVRVLGAHALELPSANNLLPTLNDLRMGELPFTSMALGFKLFGLQDWTGRLPLAVWGFAGAVALYEMLARLVDRRAGLYGVIALVTMPLYFMQARTMLGDVVTMASFAIALSGLAGAMLDEGRLARVVWAVVGAAGLAGGFLSRGLIIGVAVPALAVGLSWAVLRGGGMAEDNDLERDGAGALALAVGLVAAILGVRVLIHAAPDGIMPRALGVMLLRKPPVEATFDLVVRQLGHALFPWSAVLPFLFGRLMRAPVEAPAGTRERETAVRVVLLVGAAVAYGAFALLAPRAGSLAFSAPAALAGAAGLAILDLERGAPPSRALAMGSVLLGGVLFADIYREPNKALEPFVVDKPQFPRSFESAGQTLLVAVLAIFVGLGALAWFDAQPREPVAGEPPVEEASGYRSPPARAPAAGGDPPVALAFIAWARDIGRLYVEGARDLARIWSGNLLFGMVVVEAALVGLGGMIFVGRRVGWAPVAHIQENFSLAGLNLWWMMPILVAAAPGALAIVRDGLRAIVARSRLPRASVVVVAALLGGGTLAFWYYPALAGQLSPKEAFESYGKLHGAGEPLALLGVRSRAAAYYAGGEVESFTDPSRAFAWLTERKEQRRWVLVKADDLPRMNQLYRAQFGKNLPVLDGRSSQILLASNQLGGHANESWLAPIVLDDPPRPALPVDAQFEDQLEAIGWEVLDKDGRVAPSVIPATSYRLRVYLRVLRPVTGTWKAFVHIDGQQRRFNGDHNVLDGKYAMNLWRPGDVLVDDLPFQLEPNFTPGDYTVYYGFFSGETRFKVTRGQNHENRVVVGAIHVR